MSDELFAPGTYGRTFYTMKPDTGEVRKLIGLNRVEAHAGDWLAWIRQQALEFCRVHGSVSADDLRQICDQHGRQPHHVNAWGAVFRGNEWEMIGRRTSRTDSAHAREIKVWKYNETGAQVI